MGLFLIHLVLIKNMISVWSDCSLSLSNRPKAISVSYVVASHLLVKQFIIK
jgi:hypothetical protein